MDAIARGRKNTAVALQKLGVSGCQVAIAVAMNTSESSISRMKNDHLPTICQVLAHAGLKVVPVEMRCFPEDKIEALLTLSKAHLETITNANQLTWGDGDDAEAS